MDRQAVVAALSVPHLYLVSFYMISYSANKATALGALARRAKEGHLCVLASPVASPWLNNWANEGSQLRSSCAPPALQLRASTPC